MPHAESCLKSTEVGEMMVWDAIMMVLRQNVESVVAKPMVFAMKGRLTREGSRGETLA
jgi:hypothetical protein